MSWNRPKLLQLFKSMRPGQQKKQLVILNVGDMSLHSTTSQYYSCFCYLSGSPDSGAKMTCEWDQYIKWLLLSFIFLLAVLLFKLVSHLCCSFKVLWTRRWGLSVTTLQCHGMSLFCVWTPSTPKVSIRAWRELWKFTATSGTLPYVSINHADNVNWGTPCPILTVLTEFSPVCSHGRLLVFTLWCLFIKVECWFVFYPGGCVSMCRHVCVPLISDCALKLYMNYSFVELD